MFSYLVSAKQKFSSASFPVELVILMVSFLPENDCAALLALNKEWLQLLVRIKSSEYRIAVLQCLFFVPDQSSLQLVYRETCSSATILSCQSSYWAKNANDKKHFIRSSEIYAKALVKFFKCNKTQEAYDHLRIMRSELYPSLKKYPSGKAKEITWGILKKHAPYLLLDENKATCVIT